MPGQFTINETINTLKAIFEKHKNERVYVLATICCGKTTLIKQIPDCIDMDSIAFVDITEEEAAIINQIPWTKEVGDMVDTLVYRNVHVQPGHPVFGTFIVDCDVVVYLDISDELLEKNYKKRGADFMDAKKIKESIKGDWNNHKAKNDKKFY
ncbi:MAG: hypothetical protein EOM87_08730 [Clostridia bacterium]|nr:hypothetical protein [Clostridia bacterium]